MGYTYSDEYSQMKEGFLGNKDILITSYTNGLRWLSSSVGSLANGSFLAHDKN